MIIQKLIDDIVLRLYGGNPSDDVSLARPQIQFWLQSTRDMLVKAFLDKQIQDGRAIDSLYIERETCKATGVEDLDCVEPEDERIYFTLNKRPMSLAKDMGIIKVITDEGLPVLKTTLERVEVVNDFKYAKPAATNLVYYRTGEDVNILGLSEKNLTTTSFIVFYIPSLADQTLTEADDILLQDDLLPSLGDMVEEIARRELFGVQDRENDGTSPEQERMTQDWRLLQPDQNK